MSKIDYLELNGHILATFLTVLEEKSVSRAAERCEVSQSAVSHTLDKLRRVFDDQLFVRVGRGIEPTARALALGPPVQSVLDGMKSLTDQRDFDPLLEEMAFTVAANDFPTQIIFPKLLKDLACEGVDIRVRFIPSGIPSASTLRASRYRLLITPTPPDDPDLIKQSLVRSKMVIFYDPGTRKPPGTWEQYLASQHAEVQFSDTEASIMALPSVDMTGFDPPRITVPNFGTLASMIVGTDRITTQLEVMKLGLLGQLDVAPLPIETEPVDLFLIWHRREHDDPAHRWFRRRIIETAESVFADCRQRSKPRKKTNR
jgi:DNA-binding transcriptional LysR family regulator